MRDPDIVAIVLGDFDGGRDGEFGVEGDGFGALVDGRDAAAQHARESEEVVARLGLFGFGAHDDRVGGGEGHGVFCDFAGLAVEAADFVACD